MPQFMNIYVSQMTPKQKKELLGMYTDYLYFEKSLELILKDNSVEELSGVFITETNRKIANSHKIPWVVKKTTTTERDAFEKFVNGINEEGGKYSYISLYHTKEEYDVDLPKVKCFSDKYFTTTIDLDLPSPVERYVAAYVNKQKMKAAVLLIDGKFRVEYSGDKYRDMTVAEALHNKNMQTEFRTLLLLADYYDNNRNNSEIEYAHFEKLMAEITASEILAKYENKVLDLLGMYSSKVQEVVRGLFPDRNTSEAWKSAEREGLTDSAEIMMHYLNIRHLLRHQWDSLDGMGNFSPGNSKEHDNVRKDYLKSYRLFFDKDLPERIREYRKAAEQMQVLLKKIYPDFLTRETQESSSEFVQRLKDWRKNNPDGIPMISTNYPLASESHISLVGSLKRIFSQAQILDDFNKEDYRKYKEKEEGYFRKSWYLGIYSRTEANMMTYCWTRGFNFNRNKTWEYFKKNVLSRMEYDSWCKFRMLRNNLSHNHLSDELKTDLTATINNGFGEAVNKMQDFLQKNAPQFTKQNDGTFLAVHNDGLRVVVDMENMTVLSCRDKNDTDFMTDRQSEKIKVKDNRNSVQSPAPVIIRWWKDKIVDCRFSDGIYIDMRKQKICFPDDTQIHFNGENHNYFRLCDSKLFTDKTFAITKYSHKGTFQNIGRNEYRVVALGHRIRTDGKGRIVEDTITLANGKKMNIKFSYDAGKAAVFLPNGTKLNVSQGKFVVSHNAIILNYENRYDFKNSYWDISPLPFMQKSRIER